MKLPEANEQIQQHPIRRAAWPESKRAEWFSPVELTAEDCEADDWEVVK